MTTSILRAPALALAALSLVASAEAQADFTPGDLVLYNQALNGAGTTDGGIVVIDPISGSVANLLDLTGPSQHKAGSMAYDPFRKRVLFMASFTVGVPRQLHEVDALGNVTPLGHSGKVLRNMAPAFGGRIYCFTEMTGVPLRYLDAANNLHNVLDASGTVGWLPPSVDVKAMVYDPGTHALFLAYRDNSSWPCGTVTSNATVHKLVLSADGTRVVDESACVQVPVDPGGSNWPVNFSRGPGGTLALVVDTNSNGNLPRMQLIDPVSVTATEWASNGYLGGGVGYQGAAATNAGVYSDLANEFIVLDTGQDVLRAYAFGEDGSGTVITAPGSVSSMGTSGETATMVQVAPSDCGELVGTYCTAKTTSSGCLPSISTVGSPSATAGSGFTITASEVEPGNVGILFYGHDGANAAAFQGGFLCVQPPTWRTGPQSSGGAGPCSGSYALDFNAYVTSSIDPNLVPGAVIHGQFWFRDPAEPISGTGLSGGVTFTLCP